MRMQVIGENLVLPFEMPDLLTNQTGFQIDFKDASGAVILTPGASVSEAVSGLYSLTIPSGELPQASGARFYGTVSNANGYIRFPVTEMVSKDLDQHSIDSLTDANLNRENIRGDGAGLSDGKSIKDAFGEIGAQADTFKGAGWDANTDTLEAISDSVDAAKGAGFVTATDSLKAISALVSSLSTDGSSDSANALLDAVLDTRAAHGDNPAGSVAKKLKAMHDEIMTSNNSLGSIEGLADAMPKSVRDFGLSGAPVGSMGAAISQILEDVAGTDTLHENVNAAKDAIMGKAGVAPGKNLTEAYDKIVAVQDTVDHAAYGNAALKVLIDENQTDADFIISKVGAMQGNVTDILADSAELQADWANGGRLDTIMDELTTQGDANEGKLGIIDGVVDGIQTDLSNTTDGLGAIKGKVDEAFNKAEANRVLLADATNGLTQIRTEATAAKTAAVAAQGVVESAAFGNGMIKADTASIKSQLENGTTGLGSIKGYVDSIPSDVATYALAGTEAPLTVAGHLAHIKLAVDQVVVGERVAGFIIDGPREFDAPAAGLSFAEFSVQSRNSLGQPDDLAEQIHGATSRMWMRATLDGVPDNSLLVVPDLVNGGFVAATAGSGVGSIGGFPAAQWVALPEQGSPHLASFAVKVAQGLEGQVAVHFAGTDIEPLNAEIGRMHSLAIRGFLRRYNVGIGVAF